jgi:hypothetical protein
VDLVVEADPVDVGVLAALGLGGSFGGRHGASSFAWSAEGTVSPRSAMTSAAARSVGQRGLKVK